MHSYPRACPNHFRVDETTESYRKLHETPANVMYFILVTHMGATLWRHRVAMFGARGAVRAYNRFADAVMHMRECTWPLRRGTTSKTRARPTQARSHKADLTRTSACETTAHTPEEVETATPPAVRDALGVVIALSPEAAQVKPREARRVEMPGQKRRFVKQTDYRPTTPRGLRGSSIFTIQRYSATSAGLRQDHSISAHTQTAAPGERP